jgi:hypothetical protein
MGGRVCTKCKVEKPLIEFRKDSSRKLGHSYLCKPCSAAKDHARYSFDISGQRQRGRDFYHKTQERQRDLRKIRYWADPESQKAKVRKWYKSHITEVLAYNGKRRSLKLNATPPWLTAIHEAQMQEMYDIARARTVQTGIEHHVDHIHPLKGNGFNGLHVPWNLQVITAFENLSKRNNLPKEDQHLMWSL